MLVLEDFMRFGLDFTIVMSSICNLNDAMNCCQDFFTDFWVPHREKSTVVSLLCFVHPGSENNRLNRSYWIILLFNAFLIESIEWKILHLLVCFELHRDVFIVTSIFGLPTIWLKPVVVGHFFQTQLWRYSYTKTLHLVHWRLAHDLIWECGTLDTRP